MAAPPEEQFGFKEKEVERKTGKSAEPAAPTSVTAAVTSLTRQRDGKFVGRSTTRRCGRSRKSIRRPTCRSGDAVTVRRGALGSYLLVTKAGIATRVKRVK